MDDQFIDFAKVLAARQLKARKKGTIFKSDEIRPADRKRIIGDTRETTPAIAPIFDDNQEIQGVVVTCSCGQKIHVYFEYQEASSGPEQP
ncbi:MAG: hypothetical protein Q9P90_00040 [candidate division KSB1 bacterium]|nr:hypothetical protein [candidate division KSB1 bacterium]